ncbi:MAG: fructosamine kinase family protein [Flavobacteriales bacterium]
MPLPGSLVEQLTERLTFHIGEPVDIEEACPVDGGSMNDAWRLETDAGRFFLKTNRADRFPSMFEAEADGLQRLRAVGPVRVPEVIAHGEDHDDSYLLLEWVEEGIKSQEFWEDFGRGLAQLHRHTAKHFGLESDNYIGNLVQRNTPERNWASFFIHQRLEPQLKMARDRRRVEAGMAFRFERLFHKLDKLFPVEPPALLHGDLWSGNFLCDAQGKPVLIDPAVYYGHREMDLAMTKLFGGFDAALYTAYNDEWPLEQGWEERVDLCNLYPQLVHVNLFGGNYVQQVEVVLRRFV